MNDKFYAMIGLAKRAGAVRSGEDMVKKSIRQSGAKLVVIACDASDNTKKSIKNSCEYYKVRYIETGTMARLGRSIGNDVRAVIAIENPNLAEAVLKQSE